MTPEEETHPVIIGLYKPDREVLWWVEGYEGDANKTQLYARMEDYVVNGNTFEILEYHPRGWKGKTDEDSLGNRAAWWDEQLHAQGYDIWKEGEVNGADN